MQTMNKLTAYNICCQFVHDLHVIVSLIKQKNHYIIMNVIHNYF